jgi:hypothetical protein
VTFALVVTFLDLSRRDAEEILDGGHLPGRRDLECVLELTAFMRASSEVEPPPPMRADLIGLLGEPPSPS